MFFYQKAAQRDLCNLGRGRPTRYAGGMAKDKINVQLDLLKLRPTEYAINKLFKKSGLTNSEFGVAFLNWFWLHAQAAGFGSELEITPPKAKAARAGK